MPADSLSLAVIEEVAREEKDQLTQEAVRTIRQKDPEKGMACLNQIEGIERFVECLRRRSNSSFYRQLALSQGTGRRKRGAVQQIRKRGS
jgi:hypothetical protein